MKKLTILLLTITLFSCQVFKRSTKEVKKEEIKTETSVNIDSSSIAQTEKKVENDITTKKEVEHKSDSVYENTKTTTEVQKFDSLGNLTEKTTTTTETNKGAVKTDKKGKEETKDKSTEKSKSENKVDLSKKDKSKEEAEKSDLKKEGEVEKDSVSFGYKLGGFIFMITLMILTIIYCYRKAKPSVIENIKFLRSQFKK
jgi:ABC-type Na+ efflux pump permease subunit